MGYYVCAQNLLRATQLSSSLVPASMADHSQPQSALLHETFSYKVIHLLSASPLQAAVQWCNTVYS